MNPATDNLAATRRTEGASERAGLASLGSDLGADFIRRVLRTTAVVALLLTWMVTGWLGWRIGLGLAAGAALSLGSLASIDWMVRQFARPGTFTKPRMAFLFLVKIPVLGLLAWLIVWAARGSVAVTAAVAAGATLVPVIILLKILGRWLVGASAAGGRRTDRG